MLAQARQLDEGALGKIYDLYSTPLYRFALNQLGHADIAEDCVAECFSRFIRALHNGKGPKDDIRAYLYRVARNWITDTYRKQGPQIVDLETVIIRDPQDGPEPVTQILLENSAMRSALLELNPKQRQVVVLKFLEGWTHQEIANSIKSTIPAVKALQRRGLNNLRKLLDKKDNEIL